MAKKKITVTVSEELYSWCLEQSELYGMSVPSLFVVAMSQYKDQKDAINQLPVLFQKLKELEGKVDN